MTRPEGDVPQAERMLTIEGAVSIQVRETLRPNVPLDDPASAALLFVGFAYADLPIGWTFTHVWSFVNPTVVEVVEGTIDACTQQFGAPFDDVPHGWKTIIKFHFQSGTPALVKALPTLDDWSYQTVLHFGSTEAWHSAARVFDESSGQTNSN